METGGDPLLNGNDILDLGETWTWTYTRAFGVDGFDLDGDAMLTNTVMVDSDQTHPILSSADVDVTDYIFVGLALDAKVASAWASAISDGKDDALIPVDANGNGVINAGDAKGILIGDINANGLRDAGETTLFVPLNAVQKLISTDDGDDVRQLLMKEALAAQLNVNNMASDSTGTDNPEGPLNLLSDAAAWLRGLDPYSGYGDGTTGNVDANGDGILSVGNNKKAEYNIKDEVFTAGAELDELELAWGMLNASGTVGNDGIDLYKALQDFNAGLYTVDPHGGYIAEVVGNEAVVPAQANDADAYWDYVL